MKLSEFFNHDFKNGEFKIFDKKGSLVYTETPQDKQDPDGFWAKYIRTKDGLCSYMEWSNGYWSKSKYNEAGQQISKKCSDGYWWKQEYDSDGNETVYTCSDDGLEDMEDNIRLFDKSLQDSSPDYEPGSLRKIIIDLANKNNTNRNYISTAEGEYKVTRVCKCGSEKLGNGFCLDCKVNNIIDCKNIVVLENDRQLYFRIPEKNWHEFLESNETDL